MKKKLTIILILIATFCIHSNAQIIYTDIPDVILNTTGATYQLDLNNDGTNDFSITLGFGTNPCSKIYQGSIYRYVRVTTLNQSKVAQDSNAYPSAITQGMLINNANYVFKDSINQMLRWYVVKTAYYPNCYPIGTTTNVGNWTTSSDKYLGLKILKNGMYYFGWVRLSVVSSGASSVSIKDYAYNSQNNQSIQASEGANYAMVQLLTGTEVCAGGSLAIAYTIQGSFNTGNVFTAQLSDAVGSFSTPVTIGSVTSTAAGTINTVIPSAAPYGPDYKVRIISSNPVQTSPPDNEETLVIKTTQSVIIITGANPACGSVTLSTPFAIGSTYQWQLNGANIQNATYTQYTASANGNYSCFVTNSCGSVISNSINQVVNALPPSGITPTGTVEACPGSTVTLSADTGNGLTYQWYKYSSAPPYFVSIGGATNSTYVANISNTYKVRISNALCYALSSTVTLNFRIPQASISNSGPLTFCTGDSTVLSTTNNTAYKYQWKKDGVNIPGAKKYTYTAFASGKYKVRVTNLNGNCDSVSKSKTVTVNCRDASFLSMTNTDELEHLSVYPNPATNSVTIKFPSDEEGTIQIVNFFGQIVFSEKVNAEQKQIDVSRFSEGMYVVRWSRGDNYETKTFSVVK